MAILPLVKLLGEVVIATAGVLVLAGCGDGKTPQSSRATSTDTSTSAPAAPSPSPPVPSPDSEGFVSAASQHLVNTDLEDSSDEDLVGVGNDLCDAFDRNVEPSEIVSTLKSTSFPRRTVIQLMHDSKRYLCPQSTTQLPKVPKAPSVFPAGYPKIVLVSSMPDQPRSLYEGTYKKAVAIAPGVWSPLAPGASVADAVNSGVREGYCASIKAYERKYLKGQEAGGSCF